jgi:hypothetical protein
VFSSISCRNPDREKNQYKPHQLPAIRRTIPAIHLSPVSETVAGGIIGRAKEDHFCISVGQFPDFTVVKAENPLPAELS